MDSDLLEVRKKRAFEAGFILYGLLWFLLAFVTNSDLVIMFLATLPVLIGLIVLVVLIESDFVSMAAVMLSPLVLGAGFYFVWRSGTFASISRTDGPVMTVIDIISTFLLYVIVFFLWGNKGFKKQKVIVQKEVQQVVQQVDSLKYKNLANSYANRAAQSDLVVNRYKMMIDDYANQLMLSNQEKEYYRQIAEEFHSCVEGSKDDMSRYHELSANYAEQIRKYIARLVGEIKELSIDARQEKHDPKEYEKRKQYYQGRINALSERLADAERALTVTHENFTTNLRSIEDKCKAINFVIGRVYSDKHGGTRKIREMLNINRVLYNTFSKITSDFDTGHVVHLMLVLKLLQKKLGLYAVHEYKLFSLGKHPKITLKRNHDGNDIILDVLAWNDDDPIKEYHAEASEICANMIDYLEKNYEIKG